MVAGCARRRRWRRGARKEWGVRGSEKEDIHQLKTGLNGKHIPLPRASSISHITWHLLSSINNCPIDPLAVPYTIFLFILTKRKKLEVSAPNRFNADLSIATPPSPTTSKCVFSVANTRHTNFWDELYYCMMSSTLSILSKSNCVNLSCFHDYSVQKTVEIIKYRFASLQKHLRTFALNTEQQKDYRKAKTMSISSHVT